ncbi:MAG: pseudouridine synthase, partial [Balneolaceae bacterium]
DDRPSSKKGKRKSFRSKGSLTNPKTASQEPHVKEEMRINKFIAHAGLCSRREADNYISAGRVKVNGKVVTELGSKVKKADKVAVDDQELSLEPFVYILLNKKSGTITTTDDEKDRSTVMDTIETATGYRVYPAGRLDRSTQGLLILTNDGDLAHRLMHPSFQVKKTYLVTPNRILTDEEVENLREGVDLEDGFIKPHSVKRDPLHEDKIIISVFEGRNHLIRRMVDHIGADVVRLKRIKYAGLSEKDLTIGRWRYLQQNEINNLRRLVKLDTLDFNKEDS